MDTSVSIVNWSERNEDVSPSGAYRIKSVPLPQWAQEIELRPGLKMTLTDCTFPRPFSFGFDVDAAPLIFCFILSGTASCTVSHKNRQNKLIDGHDCTHYISCLPKTRGVSEFCAGRLVKMVHIQMDSQVLNTLFQGQFDYLPRDFRALVESCGHHRYFCQGAMTPAMQMALGQVLNCSCQGVARSLFLEGKVLELVALQLEQSILAPRDRAQMHHLSPSDIDRLHGAKDLMIRNMQHPLSLSALARQVGLNEFKLKQGFRQIFGNTVFGFLRQTRMAYARQLLEDGHMNIKEISWAVGYTDPGRFSDAFKKQYGLRPSVFLSKSYRLPVRLLPGS